MIFFLKIHKKLNLNSLISARNPKIVLEDSKIEIWLWKFHHIKANIFVVGDFLIAISILVVFSLQSETVEIFWCFLSTNTSWSCNLWGLMTQILTHMMYNSSTIRLKYWDLNNLLLFPFMILSWRVCSFLYQWVQPFRG